MSSLGQTLARNLLNAHSGTPNANAFTGNDLTVLALAGLTEG